jgi:hypothetical protein
MNEQQEVIKQLIEHEVQLRVLKEMLDAKFLATQAEFKLMQKNSDDKFHAMEKRIDDRFTSFEKRIDDRFTHTNILLGIVIAAILIPLLKSAIGVFS